MMHEPPSFLLDDGALEWDARGYRFLEEPSVNLLSAAALTNGNPWIVFAAVLERAKFGQFDTLPLLLETMRSYEDDVFWRYCAELIGDAGPSGLLKVFAQRFREDLLNSERPIYQVELGHAFRQSMQLWSVPLILKMYLDSNHRDQTGILTVFLSRLLEPELGPIGCAVLEDAEYEQVVMKKYNELKQVHGGDHIPVLYGQAFSVRELARHMHAGLASHEVNEEKILEERHLFEAATGIDCTGFFEDGELQPLNAMAVVEGFLEGEMEALYMEPARCFWSHRIPD